MGNTRIKLGMFERNILTGWASFHYDQEGELMAWMEDHPVDSSILSSVKSADHPLVREIQTRFNPNRFNGRSPLPVLLQYQTPDTLGQDRIAALCGGQALYPERDLFIVNAGSCITYDLLTRSGIFEGGNIAPGMKMRWQAMHEFTGRLPLVDPDQRVENDQILGRNTIEALLLGVTQGIQAEIDHYFSILKLKYPGLELVMSGGDAVYLSALEGRAMILEPNLVLYGLNQILQHS